MNVRSSLSRNDHGSHLRPGFSQTTQSSSQVSTLDRPTVWLDQVEQDRLLRKQSLAQAKQGHYEIALEGLTLILDRNPLSATDYNNRGLVHYQAGNFEAALDDYNQAIKFNPRLASAYNNRANYFAALGHLAEAIADYETAVDLDPTNLRAWVNQAITFRDLEMYPQAIDNLDHALHISELMGQDTDESKALEANIYSSRGRTHHLAGDWNYAIGDYYRALDRLPEAHTVSRLSMQVMLWMDELTSV
jgi:tetratricopeptide (TPR) repeat protein